jgi:myo-inositol-1(or 4)-monophosphatase
VALDERLLDDLSVVALEVAEGVAAILRRGYGEARELVETKSSPTDMVSEIDRAAEEFASQRLSELRPDDGLLGEEGALRTSTTGVRWVIDPLDGTTNYLFGVPMWSVSIAAEIDTEPVAGVVIDPSRHEIWQAATGRGATLNGQPCRVAEGRSSLSTALVATGFGYQRSRRAWEAQVVARVLPEVRDIRRFGSAALDLCWVAGGRFDAYYEWGLNAWDLSAGRLLCQEAGGLVEITAGEIVIASTRQLFGPLRELLARAGAFDPPEGDD